MIRFLKIHQRDLYNFADIFYYDDNHKIGFSKNKSQIKFSK